MKSASYQLCILMVAGIAGTLSLGCAGPRVEITRIQTRRVTEGKELKALAFHVDITAQGLEQQQVLVRIGVRNRDGFAVRSSDKRYELAEGQVGAQKAILLHGDRVNVPRVVVEIPARQLHLNADDLPALADVGIYQVSGPSLARKGCRLPVTKKDLRRKIASEDVEPEEFYFVDGLRSRIHTLWGPFTDEADAAQAAERYNGDIHALKTTDYVWVLPILSEKEEELDWAGPCLSLDQARALQEELTEFFDERKDAQECGIPMKVRVQTFLERNHEKKPKEEP